jgi:hypothetical protein
MNVTGGSTNVTTYFVLRLAATGVEATGLTIANMDLTYVRSGSAPAAKVDATALAATDTAHTDNHAIEVDATNMPGVYRVDWPDAAFAAGVKQVILTVKVATCFTEHMAVDIDSPVNVTKISDDAAAADNCELMFDGTGYAGGTTKLGVDAVAISGDTTAADNLEKACDGTTYNIGGGAVVAASVTGAVGSVTGAVGSVTGAVGSVAANGITATSIAADALNAAAIKADAVTKIQNGLATPTNITAGTITTVTNLTNAPTNGDLTATMKASVTTACTASTPTAAGLTAPNAAEKAVVDAIKAKTDNLPTSPKKNVALTNWLFKMYSSTDHVTPVTGATVTGVTNKDNGGFAALSGSVSEVGLGWYVLDGWSQAEMNGNHIVTDFSAADCDVTTIEFLTST